MIIFLNGKFVSAPQAQISIFDHGFLYGDGVFETLRAFGKKVWNIKAHVDRLYGSAEKMLMPLPWKKEQVIKWIEETVAKNKHKKSRIRITATRGENSYDFMSAKKPTLIIVAWEEKGWPGEFYKKGIKLTTFDGVRSFPEVKTTSLIVNTIAQQDMHRRGAQEAILIDAKGFVTEGTTSNVLCIKNGKLIVPHARVLAGTTMGMIKNIARKLGMKVVKKSITRRGLRSMDEVFITSVTRGVMPVSHVDGVRLKVKAPGPHTRKISQKFNELIEAFRNKP